MSNKIKFTHGYALHNNHPEGHYTKMEIVWEESYGYSVYIEYHKPACEPVITKFRLSENGVGMLYALLTFHLHRDAYKLELKNE